MAFNKSSAQKETVKFEIVNLKSEGKPYNGTNKSTGKPYTVWSFDNTDCLVNGEETTIRLKTMSKNVVSALKDGLCGTGERSMFNGVDEIMIKQEGINGASGSASSGSVGSASPARQASSTLTMQEHDSLLWHSATVCNAIADKFKLPKEELVKLMCTCMIGYVQNGIRAPEMASGDAGKPSSTMNKSMESALMKEINKAIAKHDLGDVIEANGVSNADIIKIWNECECNSDVFAEAIKEF